MFFSEKTICMYVSISFAVQTTSSSSIFVPTMIVLLSVMYTGNQIASYADLLMDGILIIVLHARARLET
jgi:galactitol-specific phosphotransferase system IIC component